MKRACRQIVKWIEREERRIITCLVVVLILLGVGYSYYLGDKLRYPDEQDYYDIALNLARNHTYTLDGQNPTAIRPPGYPLLLAILLRFSTSIVILRIANFIALGFSIYLLYRLLKTQANSMAAVLGALLVYAYPVLFYTAGTIYPQTIAGFLLLTAVYLASKKDGSVYVSIAIGLLFGYLVLMIPTFVVAFVVLLAWLIYTHSQSKYHMAIVIVACLLAVTPWTFRNYRVFHSFVFISTNSGLNLLIGNSENTTANGGVTVDISKYSAGAGNLGELDRDEYYKSQAITFIVNNKIRSMKLYLLKLLNYFNVRNELWTNTESSELRDLVMLLSYGFILAVVIIRIALFKIYQIFGLELLIFMLYISNALITALFFTRIRFRLPFDLLLMIVVAMLLSRIIKGQGDDQATSRYAIK